VRFSLLPLLTAILVVACGENTVGPDTNQVQIDLRLSADSVPPGGRIDIDLRVVSIRAAHRIDRVELEVSGIYEERDSLPTGPLGGLRYLGTFTIPRLPIEGSMFVQVFAWSGKEMEGSVKREVRVRDGRPPTAYLEIGLDTSAAEPGDSVAIRYGAEDDAGIASLELQFLGAAAVTLSRTVTPPEPAVADTFLLPVPTDVVLGDSVDVLLVAHDLFGKTDTVRGAFAVTDLTPPEVTGAIIAPGRSFNGRPLLLLDDSVHLRADATDGRGLTWIGYVAAPLGLSDSISASGRSQTSDLGFRIAPPGADTVGNVLVLFARDSVGNRTEYPLAAQLVGGVERQLDTVVGSHDPFSATPTDWALDAKRDRVLVVQGEVVEVADLASMAVTDTIQPPGTPHAIDILLGGDSAVVTFAGSGALGIIDLTVTPLQFTTLPLVDAGYPAREPYMVRAVAPNRVFIMLARADGQPDSSVYEVDFATGNQRLRGDLMQFGGLWRSRDGTYLLHQGQQGIAYRTSTDQFTVLTDNPPGERPAMDSTGSRMLILRRLYDDMLQPIGDLLPEERFPVTGWTLSPDAGTAYFAALNSYTVEPVRVSDLSRGPRMFVPASYAKLLMVLNDGRLLLHVGQLVVLTP